MMVVDIDTEPVLQVTTPRELFRDRYVRLGVATQYDVTPDGRILMLKDVEPDPSEEAVRYDHRSRPKLVRRTRASRAQPLTNSPW